MLSCCSSLTGPHSLHRYRSLVFLGAFLAARCGSPTSPTPAPDPAAPTLACPAPQSAQSIGGATAVVYPSPVATAGKEPLSAIVCAPPSGSPFAVGTTTVMCTVTDAIQRSASCSFTVTVAPPPPPAPRLSVTRIVAFGDSITEGKFADATFSANPYPLLVQSMLRARYTAQASAITVANRGVGGETAQGGMGRLPGVLAADKPEVLLLLEGVNDLSSGNPVTIQPMIDALRLMVRQGRNSGAQFILATLLPERAGPGTPQTRNGALPLLNQANDQIRRAAALEGATLLDLFQGLGGVPDPWIGSDNLHPNDTGYQKIAQLFFDTMKARFEVPSTLTLTAGPFGGAAERRAQR